jgi:hypothetical protein
MPLCIALVPTTASAPLWERCMHPTPRGDRFCADHRRALNGAVMGFIDTKKYRHAQATYEEKTRRDNFRRTKRAKRAYRRAAKRAKRKARAKVKKFRNPKKALARFFGE